MEVKEVEQGFQITPGNRNHQEGSRALANCANPNSCFYCLLLCIGKTVWSSALY